jgi:hypothetical protein
MKKVLFGLSLIACAFTASAESTAAVNCISFAPAGFCDGMQYDSNRRATWVNWDCAADAPQTKASYRRGTTFCDGTLGCNPAAAVGFESLSWKFNKAASTGTLSGVSGGQTIVLQQDMPVTITAGACAIKAAPSGISSLSR